MIQAELQMGDTAGYEHFCTAGGLLVEAKGQVAHGQWGRWLSKNFELSDRTAQLYMQWARHRDQIRNGLAETEHTSLFDMTGGTERRRNEYGSKQQRALRDILRDLARDEYIQQKQSHKDELQLHRELAVQLVDTGYRALATRLHG
jgi:hypothetical protein